MIAFKAYSRNDLLKLLAVIGAYVLSANLTLLIFGTNNIVNFVWVGNAVALAAVNGGVKGSQLAG